MVLSNMALTSMHKQFNGTPESDPIFSKKRVADTLTYGYLEMLGTLSKHKEGIESVDLLVLRSPHRC